MVQRWICTDDECLHEDDAGDMVLHSDYAKLEAESLEQARLLGMSAEREIALRAKADRLARLLQGFTIFDWRTELKGSQLHPEDVDRIELDAMEAAEALAAYREGE